MKESMNTQRPQAPRAPPQVPQHYLQPPPPVVLQNSIPHEGVMNTQQEINSDPPQMGKYQNPCPNQPRNLVDHNILLTSEEKILLQTRGRQYRVPPKSTPTTSRTNPNTARQPLIIPRPNIEPNPHIPSHTFTTEFT
jgi:hypothetical protein